MDFVTIIYSSLSAIVASSVAFLVTYFNFRKNHRTKISTQKIGEAYEEFFSFVLKELLPKKVKDEKLEEKMRHFYSLFMTWGDAKTLDRFIEFRELGKKMPEINELGPKEKELMNALMLDSMANLLISMRRGLGYKKISKVDIMSIIVNEDKERIKEIFNQIKSIPIKKDLKSNKQHNR